MYENEVPVEYWYAYAESTNANRYSRAQLW